eukprot:5938020-Pyramimonas_sp.AAC.1
MGSRSNRRLSNMKNWRHATCREEQRQDTGSRDMRRMLDTLVRPMRQHFFPERSGRVLERYRTAAA